MQNLFDCYFNTFNENISDLNFMNTIKSTVSTLNTNPRWTCVDLILSFVFDPLGNSV